ARREGRLTMADPRECVTPTGAGTPLPDGSADPKDGDFLRPLNPGPAGEGGNPHAPDVRTPQIHAAAGSRPVRPCARSAAATQQDADEKQHLRDHLGIEAPADDGGEPETEE